MAKPRFYGKTVPYNPKAWRDLRYMRKTQRAREAKQRPGGGTNKAPAVAEGKEAQA